MTQAIQANKTQPKVLHTSNDYVKALKDVDKIGKAVSIVEKSGSLVNFSQYVKAYGTLVERVISTNDTPETNNPNLRFAHSNLSDKLIKLDKRIAAASAKMKITPPSKELIAMLKVDEIPSEDPKSEWTKTDIAKYATGGGIIVFAADKLWKFARSVDDFSEKVQNMPGALKDALRDTGNNMVVMADIAKEGTSFFGLTINEIREFLRKNFNITTTNPGDPLLVGATTMGTYWLVKLILDMGPFSVLKDILPEHFFKGLATGVSAIVGCNAINENCAQSFLDTFKSALNVLLQYKNNNGPEFAKFAGAFSFLAAHYKDALTGFFTNADGGGLRDFGLGQKAGYAMTFTFFKEYLNANHKEAHDALMTHFESYSYKTMNGALQAFEIVNNEVPKQINSAYAEFPVTTSFSIAALTAAILKFSGPVATHLWNGAAAITPSMDTVVGLGIFGTGLYNSGLVKKETVDQLLKDSEQIASDTMNWAEQKGVPGAKSVGRAIAEGIDLKAAPAVKEHINENPVSTVAGYAVGRTAVNVARQYNFGRPVQVITGLVTSALPYGFKLAWSRKNDASEAIDQGISWANKHIATPVIKSYEKGTLLRDVKNLPNNNFITAAAVSGLTVGVFAALFGGLEAGVSGGALTVASATLLKSGTESYYSEDGYLGKLASGAGQFFTSMKAGFDESLEKGTLHDGKNLLVDNHDSIAQGVALGGIGALSSRLLTTRRPIQVLAGLVTGLAPAIWRRYDGSQQASDMKTGLKQWYENSPYIATASTIMGLATGVKTGMVVNAAAGPIAGVTAGILASGAAMAVTHFGANAINESYYREDGYLGKLASGAGQFFTNMKAGIDQSYEKGLLGDGINLAKDNPKTSIATPVAAAGGVYGARRFNAGRPLMAVAGFVSAFVPSLFNKAVNKAVHSYNSEDGWVGQAASGTGRLFTNIKAGIDQSYEKGLLGDGINLAKDNPKTSIATPVAAAGGVYGARRFNAGRPLMAVAGFVSAFVPSLFNAAFNKAVNSYNSEDGWVGQAASGTGRLFTNIKAGFDESYEKGTLIHDGLNLVTDNQVASTVGQVASLGNEYVIQPATNNRIVTPVKEAMGTFAKENVATTVVSLQSGLMGAALGATQGDRLAAQVGKSTLGAIAGAAIPVLVNLGYYNAIEPGFEGAVNYLGRLTPNFGEANAEKVLSPNHGHATLDTPEFLFSTGTTTKSSPKKKLW